jgi:hypothetical protein
MGLMQYDRARMQGKDERVSELREITLRRATALSRVSEEHARLALLYEAILAELAGEKSDAFGRLIRDAETRAAAAESDEMRKRWEEWSAVVKSRQAAARRAVALGTSFFDEIDGRGNAA